MTDSTQSSTPNTPKRPLENLRAIVLNSEELEKCLDKSIAVTPRFALVQKFHALCISWLMCNMNIKTAEEDPNGKMIMGFAQELSTAFFKVMGSKEYIIDEVDQPSFIKEAKTHGMMNQEDTSAAFIEFDDANILMYHYAAIKYFALNSNMSYVSYHLVEEYLLVYPFKTDKDKEMMKKFANAYCSCIHLLGKFKDKDNGASDLTAAQYFGGQYICGGDSDKISEKTYVAQDGIKLGSLFSHYLKSLKSYKNGKKDALDASFEEVEEKLDIFFKESGFKPSSGSAETSSSQPKNNPNSTKKERREKKKEEKKERKKDAKIANKNSNINNDQ